MIYCGWSPNNPSQCCTARVAPFQAATKLCSRVCMLSARRRTASSAASSAAARSGGASAVCASFASEPIRRRAEASSVGLATFNIDRK
ncbi:MAG: hypothetical protein JWQ24_1313 [Tardiphaga sp.]|nr:hypothetical protein [Tardiphaga sp.]